MNRDTDRWVRSDEARAKLRDLLDEVGRDGAHVYVLRYEKPAGVIVPVGWHDAVESLLADLEALAAWHDRAAALRAGRRAIGLRPRDPFCVHHIDGDPRNNDPANLKIVDPGEEAAR